MKLRSIFNKVVNKCNGQTVLNPKKKLIRKLGYDDIDDILDIKLAAKVRENLYKD